MLSGVKDILEATTASMASMVHVGGLLILVMSVYAVIGMKLFWNIEDDGLVFNSHANFRTFPTALLVMFRIATVCCILCEPDVPLNRLDLVARLAARQLERPLAQRYERAMRHPRRRRLRRGHCRRFLLLICSDRGLLFAEYFRCSKSRRCGFRLCRLVGNSGAYHIGDLGPHERTCRDKE